MQKQHSDKGRVLARALAQELKQVQGGDVIATHPPGQRTDITQISAGDVPAD